MEARLVGLINEGNERILNRLTEQGRDISTMLELLGDQQNTAQATDNTVQAASKAAQTASRLTTDLLRRVRELESAVAALQDKLGRA
jgi:hypothetical protein